MSTRAAPSLNPGAHGKAFMTPPSSPSSASKRGASHVAQSNYVTTSPVRRPVQPLVFQTTSASGSKGHPLIPAAMIQAHRTAQRT